jgi:hypothetical protein
MKIKISIKYLCAFLVILTVEVLIALFTKDNFIREHLGDVLVVVLIYCFIKTFIRSEIKLLWLYIFLFAALVEIGQYYNFVDMIGLGDNRLARIIFGTTFDVNDIICYLVGCVGIWIFERVITFSHQVPPV